MIHLKIKDPKMSFHSDAIEEPFWFPKKTYQWTVLNFKKNFNFKNLFLKNILII